MLLLAHCLLDMEGRVLYHCKIDQAELAAPRTLKRSLCFVMLCLRQSGSSGAFLVPCVLVVMHITSAAAVLRGSVFPAIEVARYGGVPVLEG